MNNSLQPKGLKYIIKQIDQQINCICNASQISTNQQYLAYGGRSEILKIYDIKKEIMLEEIQMYLNIIVCQFTCDSSLLFLGCGKGWVIGFDCLRGFIMVFRKIIHNDDVTNIRTIKNQFLITSSIDNSIIKTSIKTGQQIFKLIGYLRKILAIDFCQINDMIISGSCDKSIKVWNCMKRIIIINKLKAHPQYIQQLQLFNDNTCLMSLDISSNLQKWRIDFIQKELTKLQEIKCYDEITSFHQDRLCQNLLLICESNFQILNQQGECIYMLELEEGEYYALYDSQQLDKLKVIQLKRTSFIQEYQHYINFIEIAILIQQE